MLHKHFNKKGLFFSSSFVGLSVFVSENTGEIGQKVFLLFIIFNDFTEAISIELFINFILFLFLIENYIIIYQQFVNYQAKFCGGWPTQDNF